MTASGVQLESLTGSVERLQSANDTQLRCF